MPATDRRRIDYQPGRAALDALEVARKLKPNFRQQELLDWLVIAGASALTHPQWSPPPVLGEDRDRWTLPSPLQRGTEIGSR